MSLAHIVERLDHSRYRAVVALPSDGPLVGRLERAGAKVAVLPRMKKLTSRKGKRWLAVFGANFPWGVASLASLIRRENIALVHTNTIHNLYGWAAARITGRPHVWHVREIVWQNSALRSLERWLAQRFSDRIVVTSDAVAALFERDGVRHPAVVKIANGVDAAWFAPADGTEVRRELGIEPGTVLAGAAARMDVWKGLDDFIDAAAIAHATEPALRFVIAGGAIEGVEWYEEQLRARAASRGLDGVLTFAGWKYGPDRMPSFYRALDIAVLPSREPEPFGLVVLEAMASGKPVVATRHGGPLEIVVEGQTGVFVEPKNPQSLADGILSLARDAPRRAEMGRAARERVTRDFSIDATVSGIQKLYDEVLA